MCRALVEGAIPHEAVKARLNEFFVAVAIDCEQPAPEVQDLWDLRMPWAHSLPFVFYTDEEGQFLHGTSGGRSAVQLLGELAQVAVRT